MQASGLGTSASVADPRGLVRNPTNTQPSQGAQNAQGQEEAQPSAQTPNAAPDAAAQAALNNAQNLQKAGVMLQETLQNIQRPAVQTPASGAQTSAAELLPQPSLPELPAEMPELPTLDAMPRQDGNFQAFLQKLADTPSFAEGLNPLLLEFDIAALNIGAGTTEIPEELAAFAELLPKDETQLAGLVREQVSGGSRFTGELFDRLRDAYAQSPSKAAKTDILQFLRRFNDYTSAPRIERSIVRTLGQLAKAVPSETARELETFSQELEQHFSAGDRAGALKLLQGKVLPRLSDFSDHHPDMRLPNTLISILKPMASRYEGSSEEGLLQAFRQLAEHMTLRPHLGHLNTTQLMQLVKDSDFARAKENDRFAEQLAKTADWAMKGKGGGEPRKIFRQLVSNLLLNKSVYLPLEHAVIPMEWNGKRVVSELWVDPDADQEQHLSEKDRLLRFLLHMDIPGLGPFDVIFAYRSDEVDMQIACPQTVVPFSQLIHKEISHILEDNGLKMTGLQVRKWKKPLSLTEAFPRIVRSGGTGVNLKL